MNVQVKICGIRSLEAAKVAVESGADFLGLNFVPASRRFIDPDFALEIIKSVGRTTKFVGVFQNETFENVQSIAKKLGLDFVQLHGKEDMEYIKKINVPVIKMIHESGLAQNYSVDFFLLDRKKQGQGLLIDRDLAQRLSRKFPLFLAGGLTPENVSEYVQYVRPFAVDVAGGVEKDGKQDLGKIKTFIKNTKGGLR